MKKRLISSLMLLFITLGVFTTAVAAWFTPSAQYINNIIFTAGTIEGSGALYEVADFDRDGTLDIVGGENVYTAKDSITIVAMKPGDVYTYRLDITNIGDLTGELEVYFDGVDESLKNVLTFSSVVKDGDGEEIYGAGVNSKRLAAFQTFASVSGFEPESQVSVFFQITFETLQELKILDAEMFAEKQDLNEYKNSSFSIAKIIIKLTQSID